MLFSEIITQDKLDVVATYMDDDIRETVHSAVAPCTPAEFLETYIMALHNLSDSMADEFEDLLHREFSIDVYYN